MAIVSRTQVAVSVSGCTKLLLLLSKVHLYSYGAQLVQFLVVSKFMLLTENMAKFHRTIVRSELVSLPLAAFLVFSPPHALSTRLARTTVVFHFFIEQHVHPEAESFS